MRTHEAVAAHQTSDAMTADVVAASAQLTEHARRPVGATRPGVDLADLFQQRGVLDRAWRRPARLPGVAPRPRDACDWAQIADAVVGLVIVDEPEADHRLVSRAKYAAAL